MTPTQIAGIIGVIVTLAGLIFTAGAFVAVTRYAVDEIKKQFAENIGEIKTSIKELSAAQADLKASVANVDVRVKVIEGSTNHRPK